MNRAGRLLAWVVAVMAFAAVAVSVSLGEAASGEQGLEFTDWIAQDGQSVATGTLLGHGVSVTGPVGTASTFDDSFTSFNRPYYTPPLAKSDEVYIVGTQPANVYTIKFDAAVLDPVFDFSSLGSTVAFPAGTVITRLSGTAGLTVSGSTVSGAPAPTGPGGDNDSNGTVQLTGTFTSLTLTVSYQGGTTDGIYMQIGGSAASTTTTTTTTSKPPPPPPVITGISSVGANLAPGTPAVATAALNGPATEIDWDVNGDGHTDAICPGSQSTLLFHPPLTAGHAGANTVLLSARAIGAGGTGPARSAAIAYASQPTGGLTATTVGLIARTLATNPVFQCTSPSTFHNIRPGETIRQYLARQQALCYPVTVVTVSYQVRGCLAPVTGADDVPDSERATVTSLAQQRFGSAADTVFKLTDGFITKGPVFVNGVELDPAAGAAVVVDKQLDTLLSSDAAFKVGGIPLQNRRDFQINTAGPPRLDLGDFQRAGGGVVNLGGLGLDGDVDVTLDGGGGDNAHADIGMRLKLPSFLGGGAYATTGWLGVDGRFRLNSLTIGPVSFGIAGQLGVSDFKVAYDNGVWTGQLQLCVAPGVCIDARPVPGVNPEGGVQIGPGDAFRVFANLQFPGLGLPLFSDVYMNQIGAGLGYPPLRFLGGAHLTAATIFQIDGALVFAFGTPTTPYQLAMDRNTVGNAFPADAYDQPRKSFTLAASADAYLTAPLFGRIKLGGAYFLYQVPGIVRLGGGVDANFLGVVTIRGGTTVDLNVSSGRFNINGRVDACLADIPLLGKACWGSVADISDRGAGGCVEVGPFSVGGGVVWSPHRETHLWPFDGCRWSPFADFAAAARAAAVNAPMLVRTKAGERSQAIELDGATGAPAVHVIAADGSTLDSSSGPGFTRNARIRILRSESLKMTVIGLVNPKAGINRITLLPGSVPVSRSSIAADQPTAHITASLSGQGSRRTLTYDIAKRDAQRVTFYERSGGATRVIGTASGGRGSLSFAPTPGRDADAIDAQFELAGLPAERLTVARFTPPPPTLDGVRKLRVRHTGSKLKLNWAGVAGAERYEIVVKLRIGGQQVLDTTHPSAAVVKVPRWSAGTVTVRALAPMRASAPTAARFAADGPRPPTRLKPLKRL